MNHNVNFTYLNYFLLRVEDGAPIEAVEKEELRNLAWTRFSCEAEAQASLVIKKAIFFTENSSLSHFVEAAGESVAHLLVLEAAGPTFMHA